MATEQKTSQIDDIIEQIQNLRKQGELANTQVKTLVEKRNLLNEQVKQTLQEINGIKVERDALNERVKLLKQQRDEVRAKSAPVNEEINGIKEKIAEIKKKLPRESYQELKKELDAIEWKISTTSLDLQEEKRLIGHVKELETLLSGYRKIEAQNKKIKELLVNRKVFEDQANVLHNELTEVAKKSQDLHASMMEKLNAVKAIKAQADSAHQEYIKTKESIVPMYVKIGELVGQMRVLKAARKEEGLHRKLAAEQAAKEREQAFKFKQQANAEKQQIAKEKEQALKEKLGAEARNKLQRGEKLSWNEFQLYLGEDDKESETQN
jgi:phosphoserine phosphatase